MLTRSNGCIYVALCLDAQLVACKADPMRGSLVRRVPLAESMQKRQFRLPPGRLSKWRKCRKISIALTSKESKICGESCNGRRLKLLR